MCPDIEKHVLRNYTYCTSGTISAAATNVQKHSSDTLRQTQGPIAPSSEKPPSLQNCSSAATQLFPTNSFCNARGGNCVYQKSGSILELLGGHHLLAWRISFMNSSWADCLAEDTQLQGLEEQQKRSSWFLLFSLMQANSLMPTRSRSSRSVGAFFRRLMAEHSGSEHSGSHQALPEAKLLFHGHTKEALK